MKALRHGALTYDLMQKFISEKLESQHNVKDLYIKVSDFNELGKLMPEQIVNWQCDDNTCSFTISGMADIKMHYKERINPEKVIIASEKAPFDFEIMITLEEADDIGITLCQTILSADLNPMLSMLASRPLKHLVETINSRLAL